jgi:hypothetical protein
MAAAAAAIVFDGYKFVPTFLVSHAVNKSRILYRLTTMMRHRERERGRDLFHSCFFGLRRRMHSPATATARRIDHHTGSTAWRTVVCCLLSCPVLLIQYCIVLCWTVLFPSSTVLYGTYIAVHFVLYSASTVLYRVLWRT